MCGITGYLKSANAPPSQPDLPGMLHRLKHRGPDDYGVYTDEAAGLATHRLSIIDIEGSHQPISNETGTIYAVCNGEIYNFRDLRRELEQAGHRFTTQGDTEVLVHGFEEWGDDLPRRLRGMFAFAVWDSRQKRLFLARDHFGIKPLYYADSDGTLLFSSEIKSLLVNQPSLRQVDPCAIDSYLSLLYIPEPHTIYRHIKALPPAHTLSVTYDGARTPRQYWHLQTDFSRFVSRREAVRAVRDAFSDSVQSQLVADVPLGVFLSGGIDSAGILSVMARHSPAPVRTFTIGFGNAEKNWDETNQARRIAQHFGAQHHEFIVQPDITGLLPDTLAHFDQPFANPTAVILYLLAGKTGEHVKAVLSGTGGDELFGGYPRYTGMVLHHYYQNMPHTIRRLLAQTARAVIKDNSSGWLAPQRARRFAESGTLGFAEAYTSVMSVTGSVQKNALYSEMFREQAENCDGLSFLHGWLANPAIAHPPDRLMLADMHSYLPNNQLAYADRMGMAQSLEIRVPFLDQKLVSLAGDIPLRWKIRPWQTKSLLREAMKPLLPDFVLHAPKKGLNLPIALWLRGKLSGWMGGILSPERLSQRGILDHAEVALVIAEHLSGRRDNSLLLWALIALELWFEASGDTV